MKKKVVFVCTGNTCRSPMAEAVFNDIAKDITGLFATSCGICADGISPLSENARLALHEQGIEFSHTSRKACEEEFSDAFMIIGITSRHAMWVLQNFPKYKDKVYAMPSDISDPYGGDLDVYRKCLDEIRQAVMKIIIIILGDQNEQ